MEFSSFQKQSYLNLETLRRSGETVRTPVWFAQDEKHIYVRTIASSGKVKRVRNFAQVKIAPCTASGEPVGDWIAAEARVGSELESSQANALLNRKYGLQKRVMEWVSALRGAGKYAVIVIEAAN